MRKDKAAVKVGVSRGAKEGEGQIVHSQSKGRGEGGK